MSKTKKFLFFAFMGMFLIASIQLLFSGDIWSALTGLMITGIIYYIYNKKQNNAIIPIKKHTNTNFTSQNNNNLDFYVKGSTHYQDNYLKAISKSNGLEEGDGDQVKLVPEPSNRYDKNAIKVLWFDELVGYVPKEDTYKIKSKKIANLKWELLKPRGKYNFYTLYIDIDFTA